VIPEFLERAQIGFMILKTPIPEFLEITQNFCITQIPILELLERA
jgi:hypothetical protein